MIDKPPTESQIKRLMMRAAIILDMNADALQAGSRLPNGKWDDLNAREDWVREKKIARDLRRFACFAWK